MVLEVEHVWHPVPQSSQVVPFKYFPETHDKQSVEDEQFTQGDTHAVQLCPLRKYPLTQESHEVWLEQVAQGDSHPIHY